MVATFQHINIYWYGLLQKYIPLLNKFILYIKEKMYYGMQPLHKQIVLVPTSPL